MSSKRKNYSAQEKAKIALEALRGELTHNEITSKYGVHNTQINNWTKQLKSGMAEVFKDGRTKAEPDKTELIEELYKQIGQLKVELDWLKKKSELFN